VLGVFSATSAFMPFNMEIDQAFIAAILTVIGYSLNDTVVVFDRIREIIGFKGWNGGENVNEALNSTLSRTLNTSLTTLIVLLAIFIFGGETLRGFMFAMIVGIVVGTYSSLFIATPVMFDTLDATSSKEKK
jgi:SecD/SecF fusion protein